MRKDAVIDKLVGDEVMGLFIPLFIGEDPIRKMVEAGIELLEQTAAVGLEVGAGADFGVAYVGNVGEEEVKDFTALADVVNTAARLQAQAQPAQLILRRACTRPFATASPLPSRSSSSSRANRSPSRRA
jgi:adenylate cyclase